MSWNVQIPLLEREAERASRCFGFIPKQKWYLWILEDAIQGIPSLRQNSKFLQSLGYPCKDPILSQPWMQSGGVSFALFLASQMTQKHKGVPFYPGFVVPEKPTVLPPSRNASECNKVVAYGTIAYTSGHLPSYTQLASVSPLQAH